MNKAGSHGREQAEAVFKVIRPKQWAKNIFVFAGLIFANRLFDLEATLTAGLAFVVFCAASSAGYIFNDLYDRENDRLHPIKRKRPIASGQMSVMAADLLMVFLVVFSLVTSFWTRFEFGVLITAFMAVSLVYTIWLKHVVIIDIMVIATLFVLRAVGGAIAIDVPISSWLLICTTLLALFLILGKRYHEISTYGEQAMEYRRVISDYSESFIREMLSINAAATLIAYSLYSFFSQTASGKGEMLMLTIPFVIYGMFRYLYLIYEKGRGGSPEQVLLSDLPTLINMVLWVATSVIILYFL